MGIIDDYYGGYLNLALFTDEDCNVDYEGAYDSQIPDYVYEEPFFSFRPQPRPKKRRKKKNAGNTAVVKKEEVAAVKQEEDVAETVKKEEGVEVKKEEPN